MTLVSECDISVSKTSRFRNYSNCWDGIGIGFENFWFQKKVSVSVSKKIGIEKSIGIGFEKFWYRKKYWYRFRKILVSKKVSVSVSEKNRYRKKYRIRYRKNLVSEKSFGFGFVQILGFVTHWCQLGGAKLSRCCWQHFSCHLVTLSPPSIDSSVTSFHPRLNNLYIGAPDNHCAAAEGRMQQVGHICLTLQRGA